VVVFGPPTGLALIAHFTVDQVQTWGNGEKDAKFKERIRQAANLPPQDATGFEWFAFCIRCIVGESRNKEEQRPDVENIP